MMRMWKAGLAPQLVTPRSLCILCDIWGSNHFPINNLAYILQLLSVSSSEPKPIWLCIIDFKWIASAADRDGCLRLKIALYEPHSKRASTQWLLALLLTKNAIAGYFTILAGRPWTEFVFAFVEDIFISQICLKLEIPGKFRNQYERPSWRAQPETMMWSVLCNSPRLEPREQRPCPCQCKCSISGCYQNTWEASVAVIYTGYFVSGPAIDGSNHSGKKLALSLAKAP